MNDGADISAVFSAMFDRDDPAKFRGDPDGRRDEIRGRLERTFDYMFGDIEREIRLAEGGSGRCCESGGGNYLAALGLLCYTEYMGSWITGKYGDGQPTSANFNAFFRLMGEGYTALLDKDIRVYDVFRNGMAHRYSPKEFCEIHMLGTELDPPVTVGIAATGQKWPTYRFIVRNYYHDFKRVCLLVDDVIMDFPRMPRDLPRPKRRRT